MKITYFFFTSSIQIFLCYNIYIFVIICWKVCNVVTTCEFSLYAIKLSSDFLQGSNTYNLWENSTQICCPRPFHCSCYTWYQSGCSILSIAPATPGTSLAVVREITCTYNFRLNSEMCNMSIRNINTFSPIEIMFI